MKIHHYYQSTRSSIILILIGILIITALGTLIMFTSSAATTYQPLVAGATFAAGWSDGLHSDADNRIIIDKMAASGIKRVRIDIGWSTIEDAGDVYGGASDAHAAYDPAKPCVNSTSDPGCWYYGKIDRAVDYARSKGIKVLGIWWTTPTWARDAGAPNDYQVRPGGYPTYPEYAESAEWAAKHWAGRIDEWEIWNEADPDQIFWQSPTRTDPTKAVYGGTQQYAELLKITYPAIKRGNENAKVLVSGASSVNDTWISQLYSFGIHGSFDIMGIHAYESPANRDPLTGPSSSVYSFMHIPTLRQLMINNGDSDKPIWITEMGWSTHTNEPLDPQKDVNGNIIYDANGNIVYKAVENWTLGVTEQQQGDYLVKAFDYAKKNWPYLEVLINYTDKDRSSASGSLATQRHQKNYGILYTNNQPKLAVGVLSNYLNSQTATPNISPTPSPIPAPTATPSPTSTPNFPGYDFDKNGLINGYDINIVLLNWSKSGPAGDADNNGIVNGYDLSLVLINWKP
jgi:hypothetical protein